MLKDSMGDMMKQAQKMREQIQSMQEKLAHVEVLGESGAGLVQVTMNGRHDVRRVTIDPSLMTEGKDMLEDLLAAAVNDAVRKLEKNQQEQMSEMGGGMDLPTGFKMSF